MLGVSRGPIQCDSRQPLGRISDSRVYVEDGPPTSDVINFDDIGVVRDGEQPITGDES